jgi:hypothetical protein
LSEFSTTSIRRLEPLGSHLCATIGKKSVTFPRDAEAAKPFLDAAKTAVRAYSEPEAEKAFDTMIMGC